MKPGDLVRFKNKEIAMVVSHPVKYPMIGFVFKILKGKDDIAWACPEEIEPLFEKSNLNKREKEG
jgi:hypothetical protein